MLSFLGAGSAFNTKLGNTAAFFIADEILYLFDCGETVFSKIIETNLLDNIKGVNVFITHLNGDHVGSLSSLIFYCYLIKKINIFVIYPNEDINTLLKLNGCTGDEYIYADEFGVLAHLSDGIDIFAVETKHIDHMKSYGYEIWLKNDICIYYSGDTKEVKDFNGTHYDYIYHDVCNYKGGVHTNIDELIEKNKGIRKRRIIGMHFDCQETIDKCKANGIDVPKIWKGLTNWDIV